MRDRQPAGTYARKVLEQWLIDLSWSSSRLEGNRYTLLDTKHLFEDGNKRTSRLAANVPLMIYNCAPLSLLDVEQSDYASAMMGVYELGDPSMAIDLFEWTYRRSIMKYRVVLESMGVPSPLRLRYRQMLTDAIGLIVRERKTMSTAMKELGVTENIAPGFEALLDDQLAKLEMFNYARYNLTRNVTEAWIEAGRPR
ncbi:hypothetical protein [Paraburkholderia sp. NMBU_R16]|uniref:hypothetical protein n=1 Tax=Paraburkholderia sp. NMBU_R16 TaxID=2698676 RepID=UPI0020B6956A|nr:hypothetical protein [Paraburkholderia sp. NMBU_R16]